MSSFGCSARIATLALLLLAACASGRRAGGPLDGATDTGGGGCPAPATLCGSACADLMTSAANCGSCGNACDPGQLCSGGVCGAGCPGTQMSCDGACIDVNADPMNCGGCGNACPSGQVCSRGACASDCATGETACGGACIDTGSDPANCGGCAVACPVPAGSVAACMGGVCSSTCDAMHADCDGDATNGCEVDISADAMNCGACATVCPDEDGGVGACSAGVCGLMCTAGLGDCDGDTMTGCETDVTSDTMNCGMCGNACAAPANATASCTGSACGFTCDTGWADCDMDPTNGCEMDVSSDESNCGGCGVTCDPGVMCTGGSCGVSCYTGTPRILVYSPGGTTATTSLGAGATVTVVTEAMWRTLTTADFGMYDIIWIGGASCSGSLDATFGPLEDTIAAWGPAVTGRVLVFAGDPDYHGGAAANAFFQSAANWLKELGRNADGGRTSLYFSYGCSFYNSPGYSAAIHGSPENMTSVFGTPISGSYENPCASVTRTAVGTSHPVLSGVAGFWSCPFHGAFATHPTDFDVLVTADTSGYPVMMARDATVTCTP